MAETAIERAPYANSRQGGAWPKAVRYWLLLGIVMLLGQVIIGGITRLTESGLSITEWEPITGAIYPSSEAEWQEEFAKYQASPQYEKIFAGMSMTDFQFIYFWEWFHRQWARIMGLVFVIGFVFFSYKGYFNRAAYRWLGTIVLLAALAASFGWIMVASGLEDRPWVDAYKLTMHLSVALTAFSALVWFSYKVWQPKLTGFPHQTLKKPTILLTIVAALQIILGGIMSGARAALTFPTWPDMGGRFIPEVLTQAEMWTVENLVEYERTAFQPALIQFCHRMTAYLLVIIGLWYFYRALKEAISPYFRRGVYLLITVLLLQVLLGILTLINSQGEVPVSLGVAHQAMAVILLTVILYLNYSIWPGASLKSVDNLVENSGN